MQELEAAKLQED